VATTSLGVASGGTRRAGLPASRGPAVDHIANWRRYGLEKLSTDAEASPKRPPIAWRAPRPQRRSPHHDQLRAAATLQDHANKPLCGAAVRGLQLQVRPARCPGNRTDTTAGRKPRSRLSQGPSHLPRWAAGLDVAGGEGPGGCCERPDPRDTRVLVAQYRTGRPACGGRRTAAQRSCHCEAWPCPPASGGTAGTAG